MDLSIGFSEKVRFKIGASLQLGFSLVIEYALGKLFAAYSGGDGDGVMGIQRSYFGIYHSQHGAAVVDALVCTPIN